MYLHYGNKQANLRVGCNCELVGREKGSQLNSQWGALTRGPWKGERRMSGRAGAPQTLAFPRVSSADSINLGGNYECDRAPQAHPEASMWVQAVYLGDDPGSTEREWSMRLEGRKPAKGVWMEAVGTWAFTSWGPFRIAPTGMDLQGLCLSLTWAVHMRLDIGVLGRWGAKGYGGIPTLSAPYDYYYYEVGLHRHILYLLL